MGVMVDDYCLDILQYSQTLLPQWNISIVQYYQPYGAVRGKACATILHVYY